MYKEIKTKEELPLKGGYYAIKTDRVFGNVHWSTETKTWTLEDGTKWEAEYPNYWLKEIETMGIFKEAQIKKMLDQVQAGQMTFSRLVELLNQENYKELAYKGQLVTMMDVVITLEAFLVHNEPVKNETEIKVKTLIDYIKAEVVDGSK